ncbi:MAG: O-antigen ligase domain-containing protein, partial [Xanthobacteraceae bacterium]
WQYYLLAAYAAFVGEVAEGFVVDTDHWRHFFLLLGLVWGLTVATINACRRPDYRIGAEANGISLPVAV